MTNDSHTKRVVIDSSQYRQELWAEQRNGIQSRKLFGNERVERGKYKIILIAKEHQIIPS